MEKFFIAKTVDEAKEAAIQEFAVEVDRITFEVIEEPKKNIFGRTKGEAKVRAFYEETKLDAALIYLKNVLAKMGAADFTLSSVEVENGANIEIITENREFFGRNGDVLDSLQYLTSLVCNRGDNEFFRISLDENGYRERRKLQLESLAEKFARNVIKTGRSSAMEPMNPFERRIVHAKIAEINGVVSRSAGQEPFRKVVIYSTEKRAPKKDDFKKKKRTDNKPKSFDFKTSFEKDYKKPRPEDSLKSGLYSKIEF